MNRCECLRRLEAVKCDLDRVSAILEKLDEDVKKLRSFYSFTFTATTAKWQHSLKGKKL